jgi:hypothetical protein
VGAVPVTGRALRPGMTRKGDAKARTLALVAEVDPSELAVRITEALMGMRRPPGMTAAQALETQSPEFRATVLDAARRAAEYIAECINSGSAPS